MDHVIRNDRRLSKNALTAAFVALTLVSTTFTTSCRRAETHDAALEQTMDQAVHARPVQTFVIPESTPVETRTFPVFVKGGESTKLSFRVPGKLIEFDAVVGRRYEKGDAIAKLDARDYKLVVARVEQALKEAEAALQAMETGARSEDVESLKASLEAARSQRATAEKQFARMESLKKDGAASDVQYDLAKTAYDGALAAERVAQTTLEKAQKGSRDEEIEMAKAKIAGLRVDLDLANNKLRDSVLHVPFSGVVTEKFSENYETILPGVPLVTLVNDASFEGELSVSEEFIARQGDVRSIECVFEALPEKKFNATLKQASSSVQKGNRSYLATISIDSKPTDGLLIGMVGVASMTMDVSKNFVFVPASALIDLNTTGKESGESAVWLVDLETQTVARQEVKVGVLVNDQAQILDGLVGGETIVGAGARFLTDGQPIRISETK